MAPKKDAKADPDVTIGQKLKYFFSAHWHGVTIFVTPLILIAILTPFPPKTYQWTMYTLIMMAVFWVTECIPLAITSFLPLAIFPLTNVLNARVCCYTYMNDSVMFFLGSLILASSVEQSGLHKRLAYFSIQTVGYSHLKLLLTLCTVTTFVSMWITNTAATSMMVPINFALLQVFEDQKILVMYDKTRDGDLFASDTTACYFCAATYSSSIGGIGTLVGTATNMVFKGLFASAYPAAPEYVSFPKFSAFTIPLMTLILILTYINMASVYFGFLRPNSAAAKAAFMPVSVQNAARTAIAKSVKERGSITFWEIMVVILFGSAMIAFFCRSPQVFPGWGDMLIIYFDKTDMKFTRDSALAMLVSFSMFLFPSTLEFTKNFTAKYTEDLPRRRTPSVLEFTSLNASLPYAFNFLLGGGFALSTAAKDTGLNDKLGEQMQALKTLPTILVLLFVIGVIVLVTNFASNVAVCNVFTPISMTLAKEINQNPLYYAMASGIAASFPFMIPVGTPGNLIAQSAAKIPTSKMIYAGVGPTFSTIVVLWLGTYLWAPVIWPDLLLLPDWVFAVK